MFRTIIFFIIIYYLFSLLFIIINIELFDYIL